MTRPIVAKLGSSLIADESGRPRADVLIRTAAAIATAKAPVVIVSSGAIALGRSRLRGGRRRLPELAYLQAASALGQSELQRLWQRTFEPHDLPVAQVLLTAADLTERRSYLNVRDTLAALFEAGAVPVINENDATATDEISFGDNDVLAAQTAVLLRAQRLVLLSNVDGILATPPGSDATPQVVVDGELVSESMFGPGSSFGRGGVASKVAAARLAAAGGVETFVASPAVLPELLAGGWAGTRFAARARAESAFKLWLRYGTRPSSHLTVDNGGVAALRERNASLLAVGVLDWSDDFRVGDPILVRNSKRQPVAHGIAAIDAHVLRDRPRDTEVIHRDKLVLLDRDGPNGRQPSPSAPSDQSVTTAAAGIERRRRGNQRHLDDRLTNAPTE